MHITNVFPMWWTFNEMWGNCFVQCDNCCAINFSHRCEYLSDAVYLCLR